MNKQVWQNIPGGVLLTRGTLQKEWQCQPTVIASGVKSNGLIKRKEDRDNGINETGQI